MGHGRGLLRTEACARVQRQGFANTNSGLIEGMAGVAVPVFDAAGRVVGGAERGHADGRLEGERLPVVVDLLQREARASDGCFGGFRLSGGGALAARLCADRGA
jgi:hypothetical protein